MAWVKAACLAGGTTALGGGTSAGTGVGALTGGGRSGAGTGAAWTVPRAASSFKAMSRRLDVKEKIPEAADSTRKTRVRTWAQTLARETASTAFHQPDTYPSFHNLFKFLSA